MFISSCAINDTKVVSEPIESDDIDIYSQSVIDYRFVDVPEDEDIVIQSVIVRNVPEPTNLIERIRKRITWNTRYLQHKQVQKELNLMSNNQAYVDKTFVGAKKYLHYVLREVDARNMPVEIAFLPGVESQYQPLAYSFSHASGMWQIIPSTAKILGLELNWWQDQRRDVVASTAAGLKYLSSLYDRFNGDWLHALAAYNAGPLRVESAINKNKQAGKSTDFWSLSLPRETRRYVPRLIALSELISHPDKYNVVIPKIDDADTFVTFDVDQQIDIHRLSVHTGIDRANIIDFNGGLNQRFTPPYEQYQLHIPIAMSEQVEEFLDSEASQLEHHWISYKPVAGDTYDRIAQKFDTDVERLAEVNQIGDELIPSGRYLLVPIDGERVADYSHLHDDNPDKVLKKVGVSQRYRMRSGDSLWKISRMFKVSINDLMRWNNISRDTLLFVGKSIYIKRATYTREEPIKLTPELQHSIISKVYYPVRSGDTLYSIANKFNINSKDIIEWNQDKIRKGILPARKTIVLHVDVTRTY